MIGVYCIGCVSVLVSQKLTKYELQFAHQFTKLPKNLTTH